MRLSEAPRVDDVEAAQDDKVRVQCLRYAQGGGAAGAKVARQTKVLQRILAVVGADGQKAAEVNRWSSVQGNESPIQFRLVCA